MLIRFIVTNYLSFGEETEFNMVTGSIRRKKEHVYAQGGIELLKTAAIYGANGAGKSNLIRAIFLLKESIMDEGGIDGLRFEAFRLNPKMQDQPTQLQVEFIYKNEIYDYGIAVFEGKIVEEWLYKTQKKKDKLIFERVLKDGDIQIKAGESLVKSPEDKLRFKLYEEELLSDQVTLLSMLSKAKRINVDIGNVVDWFENYITIIDPGTRELGLPLNYFYSSEFRDFTNELLKTFDTGVKKIALKTIDLNTYFGIDDVEQANEIRQLFKNEKIEYEVILEPDSKFFAFAVKEDNKLVVKRLVTIHLGKDGEEIEFELNDESDGTRRLFDFVTAFYEVTFGNKVFLIDEIDQSLHPHLLKKLIAKFVNDKESKGQLIFTTHDSNLLDQNIFRQDEIWFTEKKKTGETTLYPLSDYNIRYDLDIEKGYLNGRFGAIPFLGNLDDLNWRIYAS